MKDTNYITIQGWMRNRLDLKSNELLLYGLIYGFSQDEESKFEGSQNYMAESLGVSRSTIDVLIKSLIEKGLIIKEVIEINRVKFCKYKTNTLSGNRTPPCPEIGHPPCPEIGHNNTTSDNSNNNTIDWKKDFDVYLKNLNDSLDEILEDSEWIIKQEKFNPNVDIQLTIEKSVENYWGTEAGWMNKKRKKTSEIDWKRTFANALTSTLNKVYIDRDKQRTPIARNEKNVDEMYKN